MDDGPWTASRWRLSQTGQFAAALERDEVCAADGSRVVAQTPKAPTADVCHVGPPDRRIRGSLGVFDPYHGWDEQAQFPALWAQSQNVDQGLLAEQNGRLFPKPGRDHGPIWSQPGTLQVTRDVRYNSQRVMIVRTNTRTLGIRAWFALTSRDDDPLGSRAARNGPCPLVQLNARSVAPLQPRQPSAAWPRHRHKGTPETLPTLDVCHLQPWQLDEAQAIYRDFQHRTFESLHRCAVNPARIDLDQRVIADLLALPYDVQGTLERLRGLLASDPSIHDAKQPEVR